MSSSITISYLAIKSLISLRKALTGIFKVNLHNFEKIKLLSIKILSCYLSYSNILALKSLKITPTLYILVFELSEFLLVFFYKKRFTPNYSKTYLELIDIYLFSRLRAFKVKSVKMVYIYISKKSFYSLFFISKNKSLLLASKNLF